MKKAIETIFALGCICALFLGCAESPDGSCNVLWTLGCLTLSVIFGLMFNYVHGQSKPVED